MNILTYKQAKNLVEMYHNQDIANMIFSSRDIETVIKKLENVHAKNKNIHQTKEHGLAHAANALLDDIKMEMLYTYLPQGSTLFCIDVAGIAYKETRYYMCFSVDTTLEEETKHTMLTNKVALALDLKYGKLPGSGKYHPQLLLSYHGYAESLTKDLSEKLYNDRFALKCEVL